MKKTMIIIPIVLCVFACLASLVVWLFGSMFNDTGDQVWQSTLGNAVMYTFIISIATILIISILALWKPASTTKNIFIVIIGLIGVVASFVVALSPFTISVPKMAEQKKEQKQQESKILTEKFNTEVQSYIQNKKLLTADQVVKFFDTYSKVDKNTVLSGWKNLLDLGLIDPNMSLNDKYHATLFGYVFTNSFAKNNFGEVLINKGADINKIDGIAKGDTVLMELARNGDFNSYLDKINLLISHGADISIKDKTGKTALDILENLQKKDLEKTSSRTPILDTEIELLKSVKK